MSCIQWLSPRLVCDWILAQVSGNSHIQSDSSLQWRLILYSVEALGWFCFACWTYGIKKLGQEKRGVHWERHNHATWRNWQHPQTWHTQMQRQTHLNTQIALASVLGECWICAKVLPLRSLEEVAVRMVQTQLVPRQDLQDLSNQSAHYFLQQRWKLHAGSVHELALKTP